MRRPRSGGGWPAIRYVLRQAQRSGGLWRMYKALRTRNACKTCALGMGGQRGGMVNERGSFPEVCKKSVQAMAADMQGAIRPEFWSTYSLAQLAHFSPRQLESLGRLAQPLLHDRSSDYYRPVSWEEAIDLLVSTLRAAAPDSTFWYVSGRSSNEAGFVLHLLARLYGTNNVNNCSYYCHQASGVGLTRAIGTGTATIALEDLESADLVFLIGGNPASNHPRLMTTLARIRRRGGHVVVINPVREVGLIRFRVPSNLRSLLFADRIASVYVQPDIGGDLALLTGIAKRIVELGAHDAKFLSGHCHQSQPWLEWLAKLPWEEIERKSGVDRSTIDQVARLYADSKRTVFSWTMGITHHAHGVANVQAIANLALARGMVGKPGAGLLPIRGHSNVQGIGSVGVTPQLKQAVFERLESHYGLKLPTQPGLDTLACLEAAAAGRLQVGICLGGNLFGASPDARFAAEALARLELVAYLNTTLNTGHVRGLAKRTLVLPVLPRDEEPQPTTQESMFNFVRYSDGGPARLAGPRSELEVLTEVADRLLGPIGPVDWKDLRDTTRVRQMIGRVVPGFEAMQEGSKREFTIGGRLLREPRFPTADGRAVLHIHELPDLVGEPGQLRLMTVRSEGQFNTVVYEEEDWYRGQERRDVILIHPEDLQRLGLSDGQPVRVSSQVGSLGPVLARSFPDIKPGNALMYYPEANVLVPRRYDPESKTPAFKSVAISLVPWSG
ncbi:MAG: formate dehydrogenase [Pirellulaceae bacterium]|nr:MAG: formate dehydrogenase [Pirellulaceae bacterium]GIW95499.1 MAG: formate dehydrogenase [Pirellulaceae bacterium]